MLGILANLIGNNSFLICLALFFSKYHTSLKLQNVDNRFFLK